MTISGGAVLMGIADKNIMGHGYFLPEVYKGAPEGI